MYFSGILYFIRFWNLKMYKIRVFLITLYFCDVSFAPKKNASILKAETYYQRISLFLNFIFLLVKQRFYDYLLQVESSQSCHLS